MPTSAEEQDSQIVEPDFPHEHMLFSSPPGMGADDPPDFDVNTANNHAFDHTTQNQSLLNHGSFKSVVEETQYVGLEIDTQATTAQSTQVPKDLPTSEGVLKSNTVPSTESPPDASDTGFDSFIKLPEDNQDKDAGFRYGVASKPKSGQYSHPKQNVGFKNRLAVTVLTNKDPNSEVQKFHGVSSIPPTSAEYDQPKGVNRSTSSNHSKLDKSMFQSGDRLHMPPTPNTALEAIPMLRAHETVIDTGYQESSKHAKKELLEIHNNPELRNKLQPLDQSGGFAVVNGEPISPNVPLPRTRRDSQPNSDSVHNLAHPKLVASIQFDQYGACDRVEPNASAAGVQSVAEQESSGDQYLRQSGTHHGVGISEESRKRHSKGRNRGEIYVPFPESVATPSRGRKQGTRCLGSSQHLQAAKAQSHSIVSKPSKISLQEFVTNMASARAPHASSKPAEPDEWHRRPDTNAPTNNELGFHQSHIISETEALYKGGKKQTYHTLEVIDAILPPSARRDANQNSNSQHSTSATGQGDVEMDARGFHQYPAQNTDRSRLGTGPPLNNTTIVLGISPYPNHLNNQDSNTSNLPSLQPPWNPLVVVNETLPMLRNGGLPNSNHDSGDTQHEAATTIAVLGKNETFMATDIEEGQSVEDGPLRTTSGSSRVRTPGHCEPPSRPISRRGNSSKVATRPVSPTDVQPAADVLSRVVRPASRTKINKVHNSQKSSIPHGASKQQQSTPNSEWRLKYQEFIATGAQFFDLLNDYERQRELLEDYKKKTDQLKCSEKSSKEWITALESKNLELEGKIKIFTDLSSKYKKHMNEVVKSQKFLKAEAINFKQKADQASSAYKAQESLHQEILSGIKEAKKLRNSIDASAAKQKEYLEGVNGDMMRSKKELQVNLGKCEQEMKDLRSQMIRIGCENEHLVAVQERLVRDKNQSAAEIFETLKYSQQLSEKIKEVEKAKKVVSEDLNKCRIELEREKSTVGQLQIFIGTQSATHNELLDLLKQTPAIVVEQLAKEGGSLAKCFQSMNAVQAKVEEATSVLGSLKSLSEEPPAALIKLTEDLFNRFETKGNDSEISRNTDLQSAKKLIEYVKDQISQVLLDEETKNRLNNRIAELEQTNHGLVAEKVANERDTQNLAMQLNEGNSALAKCRKALNIKSDELAAALIVSSEVETLKEKIQNLEIMKSGLENRLCSVNQNISKLKEEVQSLDETSSRREQELKHLNDKLSSAQMMIKKFDNERTETAAATTRYNEETRRELIKTFEAREVALKTSFGGEIEKLNQTLKQNNAELIFAREQLNKHQEASVTYSDTIKKMNQKQNDNELELGLAKEERQRFRESKTGLENKFEDLDRKYQEKESELTRARDELHRVKETAMSTSDSIEQLDLRNRELEAELRSSREKEQELLESKKLLEQSLMKEQADVVSFQEIFEQQAVHLKRLEDRNPGRQTFDGLGTGLQMARNELATLRENLQFVSKTNEQKLAGLRRDQLAFEDRLLNIDVLEKQRDGAEDQATILRKENEDLKESLARKPTSVGHRKRAIIEQSIIRKAVTPDLRTGQNFRTSSLNTPEATLREFIKQAGAGSEPQQDEVGHGQASILGVPIMHNTVFHESLNTNFTIPFQQTGAPSLSRRLAERKSSVTRLQKLQTVALQFQPLNSELPQQYSHKGSIALLGLQDENLGRTGNHHDEESSQTGSAQNRDFNGTKASTTPVSGSSKSVTIVTPSAKRYHPQSANDFSRDMSALGFSDDTPPPLKKMKLIASAGVAPAQSLRDEANVVLLRSVQEKSYLRQALKPMKSALKKPISTRVEPGNEQSEDLKETALANSQNTALMGHSAYEKGRNGTLQPASHDRGPADFKGYVGGKNTNASATARIPLNQAQKFQKSSTKTPATLPHSPMHPRHSRHIQKSGGGLGRQKSLLRVAPQRNTSKLHSIPDSQGTQ